jgi:ligand-binding SRPBCC domain-containing protein
LPTIHLETVIAAPIELCFDLSRDVEAHTRSTSKTKERAVAGVTEGLLELGDTVTWEAVHLGIKQRLTARITRYERPHMFEDQQVQGAFRSLAHTHEFRETADGTVMTDNFRFTSPFGLVGRLADALFLERYMRAFLKSRARELKAIAESDAGRNRSASEAPAKSD